ncbi:hypothetical protein [Microbispora rosea]|uniref:hypothetical protein n=1 Tax=Microbispora rosea TaxID=58117 RepID=UPI0004C3E1EF|nr:hypothetical protein [Microbispora rosea]
MSGFTFELVPQKPSRSERKTTFLLLTGTAGPYGEVSLKITTYPEEATLLAEGLPDGSISHPDNPAEGLIAVDVRTRLAVGGVTATVTQNRRALRKEGRGLGISLGDRRYTYLRLDSGEEELRDSERGAVTRRRGPFRESRAVMVVLPPADGTDLALAMLLLATDTTQLTVPGMIVSGIMSVFNNGQGNM